jgi:hypothetical protein
MCVYALERLAARVSAGDFGAGLPSLVIFERGGRFGAGEVNSDLQPESSLMNRIAVQVGFAADESNRAAGPLLPPAMRRNLFEWWLADSGMAAGDRSAPTPGDIPSRRLHGKALRAAFDSYLVLLRAAGMHIDLLADEVVDAWRSDQGRALIISTRARCFEVDRILFVTGNAHSFASPGAAPAPQQPGTRTIWPAYPLDRQITPTTLPPGVAVGIDGLGLTAIDVILHLTEGRGGRFVQEDAALPGSKLIYRPSGLEPREIVAFSPSGLLPCCRPENGKLNDPALHYTGRFFTIQAVAQLRATRGVAARRGGIAARRPLDFDDSVLPLVVLELARLYYLTLFGPNIERRLDDAAQPGYEDFLAAAMPPSPKPRGEAAIEQLLAPLHAAVGTWTGKPIDGASADEQFDWRRLFDPLPMDGEAAMQPWAVRVARLIEQDLAAGRRGNLRDPGKAACDGVFRDLRHVFCAVVDEGGLTPVSHRSFMQGFLRIYMRLSNGAGILPTAKILALIEQGLLNLSIGPWPDIRSTRGGFVVRGPHTRVERTLPLIVRARLNSFDAADPAGELYPNLLRRGLVRCWVNADDAGGGFRPGGLELDDHFHPVDRDGRVDRRLAFMGPPAEGQRFFQSAAARPQRNSSIFNALAAWVSEGLEAQPREANSELSQVSP